VRIDDHNFGFAQIAFAREGIESNRCAAGVMLNAMEVSLQKFAQRDLPALRDIDQSTKLLDEQIDSVGLKPLLCQRMG
jgi:hypothetical protein